MLPMMRKGSTGSFCPAVAGVYWANMPHGNPASRSVKKRCFIGSAELYRRGSRFSALYTFTSICLYEYTTRMESVFEVVAEPNRRAILGLLASSQQSVGDIERRLHMSQPAVSKHLR